MKTIFIYDGEYLHTFKGTLEDVEKFSSKGVADGKNLNDLVFIEGKVVKPSFKLVMTDEPVSRDWSLPRQEFYGSFG